MLDEEILLEIWNELEPLSDLLESALPLPPATPPPQITGSAGGWDDGNDGWGGGVGARAGRGGRTADVLMPEAYDLAAQNAEDTDSGEEEPDFSQWERRADSLGAYLIDALFDESMPAVSPQAIQENLRSHFLV